MLNQAEVMHRLTAILRTERGKAHNGWRVLDAGCGASLPWLLELPSNVELVGLDASSEAVVRHTKLDSVIVGDIETYPLASQSFDLVICWDVLEHLPRPAIAVRNLARAVRPEGLLVLGVPNIRSLKARVTKITPHRFHVWVYRRLRGYEKAGQPGYGPYPVFLRREIAPERLRTTVRDAGFEQIYAAMYGVPKPLPGRLGVAWRILLRTAWALTLGRWDAGASEHAAVFRKHGSGHVST